MDNPYAPSHAPMNEPPLREQRGGRRLPFSGWWPVGFGGLAGLLLRLIFWGLPGEAYSAMLGSFIMGSPILVGAVTVYLAELVERRTWAYYFTAPMVATALYVVGSLALMIEGWICAIVIIPMFALLGGVSGLAMGAICRMTHWPRQQVVSCIAVLPLLGGAFEHRVPSADRVRTQTREMFVAAPPEAVWRELVDTHDIRPGEVESAWMYRIGVPLPSAGTGEFRDGEHLRCRDFGGSGRRMHAYSSTTRPSLAVVWDSEASRPNMSSLICVRISRLALISGRCASSVFRLRWFLTILS